MKNEARGLDVKRTVCKYNTADHVYTAPRQLAGIVNGKTQDDKSIANKIGLNRSISTSVAAWSGAARPTPATTGSQAHNARQVGRR